MNEFWDKTHDRYSNQDWIGKPSIFAEWTINFLPKTGKILELGGGQGQDTCYFASQGYEVTLTDNSKKALELARSKLKTISKVTIKQLNIAEPLPFLSGTFDVVYSHLSLHYFDSITTVRIFSEIERVLKPKGILAILTNSTQDPEYNTGEQIENDFFKIGGITKRYFDTNSLNYFSKDFKTIILDNNGETYKDSALGVCHLVRYIGQKA